MTKSDRPADNSQSAHDGVEGRPETRWIDLQTAIEMTRTVVGRTASWGFAIGTFLQAMRSGCVGFSCHLHAGWDENGVPLTRMGKRRQDVSFWKNATLEKSPGGSDFRVVHRVPVDPESDVAGSTSPFKLAYTVSTLGILIDADDLAFWLHREAGSADTSLDPSVRQVAEAASPQDQQMVVEAAPEAMAAAAVSTSSVGSVQRAKPKPARKPKDAPLKGPIRKAILQDLESSATTGDHLENLAREELIKSYGKLGSGKFAGRTTVVDAMREAIAEFQSRQIATNDKS